MKCQFSAARAEVLDLWQRLLYLAFAEIAHTEFDQCLDRGDRLGLGHGDQAHLFGRAARATCSFSDTLADSVQTFARRVHGVSPTVSISPSTVVA